MDRPRARKVALAVLAAAAIVLLAVAAAPLFAQDQGSETPPSAQPPPASNGSGAELQDPSPLPLGPILGAVLVFGLLAVIVQFADDPWGTLGNLVGGIVGIAALLGFVWLLLQFSSGPGDSPGRRSGGAPNQTTTAGGSGGFGEGTSDPLALPVDSVAVALLVAGAVGLLAVLALRFEAVRSTLGLAEESEGVPDDDLEAVGRVAGRAADRVEAAETPRAADNAIYRAWSEMVALLDGADPRSRTPRQFEAAAIEAGMDPDDVTTLTRTFEEVRYGGAALSPERRGRASAALRRIEAAHGEATAADESTGSAPDADRGEPR